jgi:GMC oxidoreductase
MPVEAGNPPEPNLLNSNANTKRDELEYTSEDIAHVEKWVKRHCETTWHSLGTCSMAPKEGNSIVKHGVLDDRLNVHGVKNLKVADLSICPDNVGCNTFSVSGYSPDSFDRRDRSRLILAITDRSVDRRKGIHAGCGRSWLLWGRFEDGGASLPCPWRKRWLEPALKGYQDEMAVGGNCRMPSYVGTKMPQSRDTEGISFYPYQFSHNSHHSFPTFNLLLHC